jgi:hypothetical protein
MKSIVRLVRGDGFIHDDPTRQGGSEAVFGYIDRKAPHLSGFLF